ncbi:hypothetical protein GALMADRAFT_247750 [Galerina marginata CBS 339.88]|uniref:Calpain catalytic domain-containing protein n=1 Tax=Galerina marginata (strain CBS 339.88) TaxID=685588 RepID=A0A067SZN1_GALM3|nr:hypothetical protein GALMADRAFT_247750 [Galerina marginata CBS 339.88]
MRGGDIVDSSEREAEAASSKASRAEFAKNYDQAFGLYIKAAESFLHLSRSSTADDTSKQRWKSNAAKALERAEKIKRFIERPRASITSPSSPTPTSTKELRLTPVGINHFSPQEQFYVIKKGGTVNGLFFPLWDDPFPMKGSTSITYSDPDGQPKLSPEQQKVSPIWRRPRLGPTVLGPVQPRRSILPQEILQYIVTDCSVCASISVCLEHSRRFGPTLESLIRDSSGPTAQSRSTGKVANGRHDVRVLFNGAWRRVAIDDQLPFHPTQGTLMCMSVLPLPSPSIFQDTSLSEETLWPSLLEKAYMKLMGGYDFPGSNSSIDLHTLAGWIPEHVEIKRSTFEREKTWQRIERGFSTGQCVVTLGTGPTSYVRWRDVPLLPSHSYAVIDAYEREDGQYFTVLDSWVRADGSKDEPSKVLQIPWSEVMNVFEGVYLSWDPNLWQNKLTFHGMWKRNTGDEDGSRQAQIEFICDSMLDEEILVLLTSHVVDTRRTSDFIALRVDMEDDLTNGMDIAKNQQILSAKGTYTNSTHILSRNRVPKSQRTGILSITASYDGDAREVGFTLTAYSKATTKISLVENKSTPPFTRKVEGSFTAKTAGGNCTYPSFMVNPQYRLVVHPVKSQEGASTGVSSKGRLTVALQTSKDMPVNVAMVWSQSQRVSDLSTKDLVASSGAYSYGLAQLTKAIPPGEYTIVASAFEPRHMGPFSLKVESFYPFDLESIPQEGAGMYSKVVRGLWDGQTAAGAPSFDKYPKNPVFELVIPSVTRLMIRLQLLQPSTAIALNVTVYPNFQNDIESSLRQSHVATSGAYEDTIAGVATPQATLGTGKYYIVPSTYNPGTETGFRMLIYSSVSGITVTPKNLYST